MSRLQNSGRISFDGRMALVTALVFLGAGAGIVLALVGIPDWIVPVVIVLALVVGAIIAIRRGKRTGTT